MPTLDPYASSAAPDTPAAPVGAAAPGAGPAPSGPVYAYSVPYPPGYGVGAPIVIVQEVVRPPPPFDHATAVREGIPATVVLLVGMLVAVALPFVVAILEGANVFGVLFPTMGLSSPIAYVPTMITFEAGLALLVFALILHYRLFHALARKDDHFGAPSAMVWVAVAGLVVVAVGIAQATMDLTPLQSCLTTQSWVPGNIFPNACSSAANTVVGDETLAGLGLIVAFVGWIGLSLGIWRIGVRLDDGEIKTGAVLLMIPLLSAFGAIPVLTGYLAARRSPPPPPAGAPARMVVGGYPIPMVPYAGYPSYPPYPYAPGQYGPGQYAPGQYPPGQYPPAQYAPAPSAPPPSAPPAAPPSASPTPAPTPPTAAQPVDPSSSASASSAGSSNAP